MSLRNCFVILIMVHPHFKKYIDNWLTNDEYFQPFSPIGIRDTTKVLSSQEIGKLNRLAMRILVDYGNSDMINWEEFQKTFRIIPILCRENPFAEHPMLDYAFFTFQFFFFFSSGINGMAGILRLNSNIFPSLITLTLTSSPCFILLRRSLTP